MTHNGAYTQKMTWTGDAVRIERGRLRMTQEELGEALGTSRRTVQAWENGERPIPLTAHAQLSEVLAHATARPDLAAVTDMELLAELMRRAAARSADNNPSLNATNRTQRVTSAVATGPLGDTAAFSDETVGSLEPRSGIQHDDRTSPHRGHRVLG